MSYKEHKRGKQEGGTCGHANNIACGLCSPKESKEWTCPCGKPAKTFSCCSKECEEKYTDDEDSPTSEVEFLGAFKGEDMYGNKATKECIEYYQKNYKPKEK